MDLSHRDRNRCANRDRVRICFSMSQTTQEAVARGVDPDHAGHFHTQNHRGQRSRLQTYA